MSGINVALRRTMTREDFLAWVERQDEPYEFDGFQPVAMIERTKTGGTNNHGIITRNLHGHLFNRLRGRSCQALPSEGGGVATIGNKIRFPDATVTCSPVVGTERFVPNPVVVFEVTGPNSNHSDTVVKTLEYQAVPSIRRYVLIDQTKIAVTTHWRPGEDVWTTEPALGPGTTLTMPEIGIEIPIDDLYERVTFQP